MLLLILSLDHERRFGNVRQGSMVLKK